MYLCLCSSSLWRPSPRLSLSDVPTESQPSTSPFISSLSLSSSEENIGKKLLRKLSEWATCHKLWSDSTPPHTHTHTDSSSVMPQTFLSRHSNSNACILATGDASCPLPQPSAAAVLVGLDTTMTHLFFMCSFEAGAVLLTADAFISMCGKCKIKPF